MLPLCNAVELLRGTIVNRTYGTHKDLYISPFLPSIFGPIYYGPPQELLYFGVDWYVVFVPVTVANEHGHSLQIPHGNFLFGVTRCSHYFCTTAVVIGTSGWARGNVW